MIGLLFLLAEHAQRHAGLPIAAAKVRGRLVSRAVECRTGTRRDWNAGSIDASCRSCYHAVMPVEIKTIGSSGQVSLGKQYAGRVVTVDQVSEGVWTIKTAQVIPDNELWLHTPEIRASIDRALAWSDSNPRSETDLNAMAKKLNKRR